MRKRAEDANLKNTGKEDKWPGKGKRGRQNTHQPMKNDSRTTILPGSVPLPSPPYPLPGIPGMDSVINQTPLGWTLLWSASLSSPSILTIKLLQRTRPGIFAENPETELSKRTRDHARNQSFAKKTKERCHYFKDTSSLPPIFGKNSYSVISLIVIN